MNAVANAVQNTLTNGMTMGEVVNEPAKEDLKKSYKAIDTAYDIVIRQGGYDDTKVKLKGLENDIGEQVYAVLNLAMEHCEGKLPIVKAYFAALCKKAEEYFLNKYTKQHKEETTIAKAIPLWPAYKSSLAKGLDLKMSPAENIPDTEAPRWPTAAKYRTEVQKREKEAKGGNANTNGGRNTNTQTTNTVNLVSKGWSPLLAGAMNVLCTGLNAMSHDEQDKFASKVLALGEEVTMFVEAKKSIIPSGQIVENANGQVTGTTQSEPIEETISPEAKAALAAALDKSERKPEATKGRGKQRAA